MATRKINRVPVAAIASIFAALTIGCVPVITLISLSAKLGGVA